ncbi:DUF805 domain-containing protein [Streptomyces sp. NPDC002044]|uniref:DUF805 domain-containing protein n=1 Tax=Streptomyces sp. NPDC002044 TaxID=3154662 RepID=UPI00332088D1
MNYYTDVLKKYADFSGRARRREYWMYALIHIAIVVVLAILDSVLSIAPVLVGIYMVATLVPSLAVTVRRLHDLGKSGWWYLIILVPLIGGIWLLVLTASEGQSQANEYGENPKAVHA